MKKIIALVAAVMFVAMSMLSFAAPANATPSADNKKVTLCHATGSATNPYTKITVSVSAFYNAGHIDHPGDIYEAFTYVNNRGDTVNVPAKGNTALLAFDDCQEPKVDEQVTVPAVNFVDKCGTVDDVLSMSPGRGYTVGPLIKKGTLWSISATADDGFVFAYTEGVSDDGKRYTVTKTITNVACDLPATGGVATAGGVGAGVLLVIVIAGIAYYFVGRRKH